ncbi:hypothetical protein Ddye_030480 [Dipteronia dyeriana]|uniref:Uncharacterized protein n=1 Tax=Dipteronia dyeriana TaxID=168575 RepID=A0AAD9WMS1_9ROSI|nr:hypothetical protein Ddye_030480 [Dipteronia dyeriana]
MASRKPNKQRFNVLKYAPIDVVADVKSERVRTNMTSGFDCGDERVFGFDFGCGRGFWIRMGSGARFDGEVGLGELGSVTTVCWIWWWWLGGARSVLVLGCVDLVLGSGNGFGRICV